MDVQYSRIVTSHVSLRCQTCLNSVGKKICLKTSVKCHCVSHSLYYYPLMISVMFFVFFVSIKLQSHIQKLLSLSLYLSLSLSAYVRVRACVCIRACLCSYFIYVFTHSVQYTIHRGEMKAWTLFKPSAQISIMFNNLSLTYVCFIFHYILFVYCVLGLFSANTPLTVGILNYVFKIYSFPCWITPPQECHKYWSWPWRPPAHR